MKQISSFIIVLIFLSVDCLSQESRRMFLDEKHEMTDSINASFIMDVTIINNHYHVTDRNMNEEIIHYSEYISVNPWIRNGLTRYYAAPNELYSSGHYSNGKLIGEWLYYKSDQMIDTVSYDLCDIKPADDDCFTKNRRAVSNTRDLQEIQMITDSLSALVNKHFHLPAQTRNNTRAFNAYIKFMLEENGNINCLSIAGVDDDDLIAEIHRIICLFNYVKDSKRSLQIEFEMRYNENENRVYNPSDNPTDSVIAFTIVQHDPVFKNDNYKSFSDFIEANLIYPPLALKYSIDGVVLVNFTVEPDGSVANVSVLRGVDPVLDSEAIRIIESSPEWKPGKQRGENIRVRINVQVPFSLER